MIRGKKSPVVHVIAYRKNADTPLQLTVTPDPLDMTQFCRGAHTITWVLDTRGYQFDEKAIEFTSPGWEKYFRDQKVSRDRRKVTMTNVNRGGLAFAYNVHVVEQTSNERVFLDPVVQNDD